MGRRFPAGAKLLGLAVLQPFELGHSKVSHLKDLYHIFLDLAAQDCDRTFSMISATSKYTYFTS